MLELLFTYLYGLHSSLSSLSIVVYAFALYAVLGQCESVSVTEESQTCLYKILGYLIFCLVSTSLSVESLLNVFAMSHMPRFGEESLVSHKAHRPRHHSLLFLAAVISSLKGVNFI